MDKCEMAQEQAKLNLSDEEYGNLWWFRKQKLASLRGLNSFIKNCFDIEVLKRLLNTAIEEKEIYSETFSETTHEKKYWRDR